MAVLTEFGKEIRKLRIERGETMQDMSDKIGKSPSFLSAIETGRKPVPPQVVEDVAEKYQLSPAASSALRAAAAKSASAFKITPSTEKDHALVAAFARKFDSLDDAQRERIFKILKD